MNDVLRQFRDFFVSLKLTVVLLALGIILVFFATLDQVNLGIWGIQQKWFRSFIVLHYVGDKPIPVFPGGYFIGGLLLINLIAAHFYRFKFTWRKLGIQLTHLGFILLLIGELLSGLWQEDFSMQLNPNEPTNYSQSFRNNELAVIDTSHADHDDVIVFSEAFVAGKDPIQHAKLPFRLVVKQYYPNSFLRPRLGPNEPGFATQPAAPATQGMGTTVNVFPLDMTYKQNERNLPAAIVEVQGASGSLGTYLLSADPRMPAQQLEHSGRTFTLALRFERSYKPFTLTLLKFSFDRYPGTQIPKNFSSKVRLQTPDNRDDREVLIYMNNPLRYGGYTFYQADWDKEKELYTILQVVRNPSWLIPYVACTLMTLGLCWQFTLHLVGFAGKRRAMRAALA